MPTVIYKGREVILDEPDLVLLEKHAWWWMNGYLATSLPTGVPYGRRVICLHRMILGDPEGLHVDHINRNRSDNRRLNLRPCTVSQNNMNKDLPKRGSTYNKNRDRWQVVVRDQGKLRWLGYYKTEEESLRVAKDFYDQYVHNPFRYSKERMGP